LFSGGTEEQKRNKNTSDAEDYLKMLARMRYWPKFLFFFFCQKHTFFSKINK